MAKSAASVEFRHVFKRYGAVTAVNDVSFTIEPGTLVTLLGPSGCGKTTLLRMLAGFEIPTSGAITIDGQLMEGVNPNKRPVNMVFQSYAVFPHMNVERNVGYGLRVVGVPETEIRTRVAEALALVKLDQFRKRMPSQLSGGQRQRVALARALVADARVLVLDDPMSAVDTETERHLVEHLRPAVRGRTVLISGQRLSTVLVADRAVVVRGGRIVEQGLPGELLRAGGHKVAVVAIDPSSPVTGGALLGDRLRMMGGKADADFFVRSLSSGEAHGGLAPRTREVVDVLSGFGFDFVRRIILVHHVDVSVAR